MCRLTAGGVGKSYRTRGVKHIGPDSLVASDTDNHSPSNPQEGAERQLLFIAGCSEVRTQ